MTVPTGTPTIAPISLVGESFELAQHDHLAVLARQSGDARMQRAGVAVACRRGLGPLVRACAMDFVVVFLVERAPARLEPVEAGVAHDRHEPRLRTLAPLPVEKAERAQAGLLDGILGGRVLAGQPARKVVRGIEVPQHFALEPRRHRVVGQPVSRDRSRTAPRDRIFQE
jgi:hypothetical protein